MNTWRITYTVDSQSFGGPYQTQIDITAPTAADALVMFAANVKGGPAFKGAERIEWRAPKCDC
jgi:hypothetical protein